MSVSYHEIAPILARHCRGCHVEGGAGPFPLTTYEEAKRMHPAIAAAVVSRVMPPWLPVEQGCLPLKDSRALDDQEIDLIRAWSLGGALEGDPAASAVVLSPPPPRKLAWVDDVVDIGEDYVAQPAQGPADDWRCFLVDPKLTEDKVIVGYELSPTDRAQVHHAAFVDAPIESAREVDDAAPGLGWPCPGSVGVPAGAVLGSWAAGYGATEYPKDTGIPIAQGRGLVLQIHYHVHDLTKGPTPDRTKLALQYARKPVTTASYVAISPADITLPPRARDITRAASFAPPNGTVIHGLVGHMHLLGKSLKVELTDAGGSSCVMDVPRWNYRWEEMHFLEKPLWVPSGTTVKLTCVWDNPSDRGVGYGLTLEDEMCDLGLITTPP